METLLIAVRFVHFSAVMSLFGSSLFPAYALSYRNGDWGRAQTLIKFLRKIVILFSILAFISALAWLSCESALMSSNNGAFFSGKIIKLVITSTEFGQIWLWRLLLLTVLMIYSLLPQRYFRISPIIFTAFFLVATLAGVGHGAMGIGFDAWLHLGNQAIHMLAASIWVGGLLSLLFVINLAKQDKALLVRAITCFSTVGWISVCFIVASGLLNAYYLVGSITALMNTGYGRVLMVKIALFLAMITLALINRFYFMLRLGETGYDCRLLLRSVAVEQCLAFLVVATVSLLGTLPPAFGMSMPM